MIASADRINEGHCNESVPVIVIVESTLANVVIVSELLRAMSSR